MRNFLLNSTIPDLILGRKLEICSRETVSGGNGPISGWFHVVQVEAVEAAIVFNFTKTSLCGWLLLLRSELS